MHKSEARLAEAAATAVASALGLPVDEAVVLHDSNKLTLRLRPCDVVARVAPAEDHNADFELDLAQRLVRAGCAAAAPDPRVAPRLYGRDGFVITFWTYHAPVAREVSAIEYAHAVARLHAAMRTLDVATPHAADRVDQALQLLASRADTPALADADRELLTNTLRVGRQHLTGAGAADQLLHGEPHPGNLLTTRDGLVFVDLETCCRGPVEFDLAHAPAGVGERYPGVDLALLRDCRLVALAMNTTWRWDRDDQLPDGRRLAAEWLGQIRAALEPHEPGDPG